MANRPEDALPRTHKAQRKLDIGEDDDVLALFEYADAALDKHLQGWGSGEYERQITVTDTGGRFTAGTAAEARKDASSRHELEYIQLSVMEKGYPSDRSVDVLALSLDRRGAHDKRELVVIANGPDEPSVIGMAQVLADEIASARGEARASSGVVVTFSEPTIVLTTHPSRDHGQLPRSWPSPVTAATESEPVRWWKRVITHSWTVEVIGGSVAAVIGGLILVWALSR